MNTDLAIQEPQHGIHHATFKEIQEQAITLANSQIIPKALRGKANDLVVIGMAANELGLGFVAAVNKIFVVEGKPTLSAELMCALVQRAGHDIWVEESSATQAVAVGQRHGSERVQKVTFTIEEAKQAGVANKDNWKKYPAAMLRARAISALCRFAFADVLMGHSYSPEELGAETDEEGNVIGATAWWAPHVEEFGREVMQAALDAAREARNAEIKPLEEIDPPPTDVLAEILAAARKAKDEADDVVDAEVVDTSAERSESEEEGDGAGQMSETVSSEQTVAPSSTEPADSVPAGSANQGSEAGPSDGPSVQASDPETVQDSEPSPPASPPSAAAQNEEEESAGTAKAPVGSSDPLKAVQQRAMERAHKTKDKDSLLLYQGCESGLHFDIGEQCPDCGWNPVANPCPECGSPCLPWEGSNPKAPKWRCTNADCTGSEDDKPWVSWHRDPWREGGEIEQMSSDAESTSQGGATEPSGEASVNADDPAPQQPALGGELDPSGPPPRRPRKRKKEQPK